MLKINGLTKNFKKVKAIDNFSFEFKNGVYGLLGPNGAGKTTLLRCISKLYPVDNDIIFYNENDINKDRKYLEYIGYLPQLFGMYKDLSVKDMMLKTVALNKIIFIIAKNRCSLFKVKALWRFKRHTLIGKRINNQKSFAVE